jgi:hypothetical protein
MLKYITLLLGKYFGNVSSSSALGVERKGFTILSAL